MGKINVYEYHNRPLEELELPDGTVWKLRQPLEADFYRYQDTLTAHRERVKAYAHELAERAKAKAEETGGDDEARALIADESDEARMPLEVTNRYMQASLVSIFLTPEQKPETLLEKLGPDIIHFLNLRIAEVIGGGAAKKRIAGS
jgi:hypothetical protein